MTMQEKIDRARSNGFEIYARYLEQKLERMDS